MAEVTGRFTLRRPLKTVFRGPEGERTEETTEVTVRPVENARDLFVLDAYEGEMKKSAAMIAQLTGLTFNQVGDLHPDDFHALVEKVQNFTVSGPSTGSNSSDT